MGARILSEAFWCFPRQAVHLVVVDPGVGTARRMLGVKRNGFRFVGPDNGCLSLALGSTQVDWGESVPQVVALDRSPYWRDSVSATFHGRDILGPVAAHLARGVSLASVGSPYNGMVELTPAAPQSTLEHLVGQVQYVDHYGNCVTNVTHGMLEDFTRGARCEVAGGELDWAPVCRTYGDVPYGAPLGLVGSQGNLEIARHGGHASHEWRLCRGTTVTVRRTT